MKYLPILAATTLLLIPQNEMVAQTNATNSDSPASTPSMEDRVGKLESNIGQILDLLKKQQAQPAPSQNSSAASTAAPAPANVQNQTAPQQPTPKLRKGPILEVWNLKNDTGDTFPTGRSIGGIPDLGDSFALGNVKRIPAFSALASSTLAFQWSGKYNIKEKGTYVFLVQGTRAPKPICNGYNDRGYWYIGLDIENDNVISEKSPEMSLGQDNPITFPLSTQIDLQPGIYTIKLKTFIISKTGNPVWNYEPLSISLKSRGPSDNIPVEIGNMNANFNHLESN